MKKFIKNIKFIILYTWNIDCIYILIRIPCTIVEAFIPIILVIFPALIVEDITSLNGSKKLLFHIFGMFLALIFLNISKNLLHMLNTNRYNLFEHKHSVILGKKIMSVKFSETENADTLNLAENIKKIGYIENSFAVMFSFLSNCITVIGLLWILINIDILILGVICLTVLLNIYFNNKSKEYNYKWQQETAPYVRRNAYIIRLMYGFQYGKEVRVHDLEEYIIGKYNDHSKEYLSKLKTVTIKFLKINNATSLIGILQLALVYYSLSTAAIAGNITIAAFTKYISAINSLTNSLLEISNVFIELKNNFNYVEDLQKFLELETNHSAIKNSLQMPKMNFSIKFENVSFAYPNTNKNALNDVNISISPGMKIAVVGLNGSGKTTFIKLLLGLYKPSRGRIYIDDIDIANFDFKKYIERFSCAFQDFRLFSYSVEENIVMAQKYDKNRFDQTLIKCDLEDVINQLPKGEKTPIFKFLDDDGVDFSGGEGQKIAIARALYKKSDVLILDEPLAALDPLAEYEMYNNLINITGDRTCIFISHRLSLAQNCDLILVFKDGAIIENGTHEELMELKNGFYANMFCKQAAFYREES